MKMLKIVALSFLTVFLFACEPPPVPVVPESSNNLGEAKWGEMEYEAN